MINRNRIGLTTAILSLGMCLNFAEAKNTDYDKINAKLVRTAKKMSQILTNENVRSMLHRKIKFSSNVENIVDVEKFNNDVAQDKANPNAAIQAQGIKNNINAMKADMRKKNIDEKFIGFDIYFPVPSHKKKWSGGADLMVAAVPMGDDEVMGIVPAFIVGTGEVVYLDQATPPETPVLVIAPEEHSTHGKPKVTVPDVQIDEEGQFSAAAGTDWIGIVWAYLYDDHEPWIKGKAEIYLLYGHADNLSGVTYRENLSGVDHDGKNYYFPDDHSAQLYWMFDESFSDMTYFRWMEEDGGATFNLNIGIDAKNQDGSIFGNANLKYTIKDGDDFVGEKYILKSGLPFGGYYKTAASDVTWKIDKDY